MVHRQSPKRSRPPGSDQAVCCFGMPQGCSGGGEEQNRVASTAEAGMALCSPGGSAVDGCAPRPPCRACGGVARAPRMAGCRPGRTRARVLREGVCLVHPQGFAAEPRKGGEIEGHGGESGEGQQVDGHGDRARKAAGAGRGDAHKYTLIFCCAYPPRRRSNLARARQRGKPIPRSEIRLVVVTAVPTRRYESDFGDDNASLAAAWPDRVGPGRALRRLEETPDRLVGSGCLD